MSNKQTEQFEESKEEAREERGFIHGVFDAKEKYNPANDFQKIPKEEFGISDWSAGYQNGYIDGIARGKDKTIYALEKMNERGLTITEALIELDK